jgi:Tfp pilus assembly protein PilV
MARMSNERGFTLVEALVAMVVCTVGLVAMAGLMAVTLRVQQLGRNSTSAVRLAQDKIDELTTMNFAVDASIACGGNLDMDVTNYNDVPHGDNGTPDDDTDDAVTKGYTRRWLVAAGPDGDLKLRTVTVRVIPDVTDNRTSSTFQLTTVIRGVSAPCP